eukprot:TRINITY_DN1842_c0_g1_i1.p1 TRINITY_DN1842_c0_g1~~TRINITY_DN1842_c0_g1_i1.p1  ORF type:complete len:177 (-),score=16.45 TRINITY_DN1842_c0_g1_i1:97-627(-)
MGGMSEENIFDFLRNIQKRPSEAIKEMEKENQHPDEEISRIQFRSKNILKNHHKCSYAYLCYKKFEISPIRQHVVPAIAAKCGITVESFHKCMRQLNLLITFNFDSLSKIWTSDELKIELSHYDKRLDLEVFKGIDLEKMAKAVQMYMKLYFRRYVINRAFNGSSRKSVDIMIAAA